MAQSIKNVIILGAGGLFGSEVFGAFEADGSFNVTVLSRKYSKSKFPSHATVITIDDDYPEDELVRAFTGQDAVISVIPGRPYTLHIRMIDAAIRAGVKRFIPTEYGNNTCSAASDLCPLYSDKAKTAAYLKTKEDTGLTWTAIHTGQFFDWGLKDGWLDFDLQSRKAVIYDSGNKLWSTTNIGTAAAAVVKVLQKPEETVNRSVHVASFTVSQFQVLEVLEQTTGTKWKTDHVTSKEALDKAAELGTQDHSEGLKLLVLMLLYAEDADRGANFAAGGLLDNKMLGLPEENLKESVQRVVNSL